MADLLCSAWYDRFELLSDRHHSQGFLSAAGYGRAGRPGAGAAGRIVPGHGQIDQVTGERDQGGPGGGARQCLYGRQRVDERRLHLHCAEALGCAQGRGARHYQSTSPQAEQASRCSSLFAGGAGFAHRRTEFGSALSVHDSIGQRAGSGALGTDFARGYEDASRLSGCQYGRAKQRP